LVREPEPAMMPPRVREIPVAGATVPPEEPRAIPRFASRVKEAAVARVPPLTVR